MTLPDSGRETRGGGELDPLTPLLSTDPAPEVAIHVNSQDRYFRASFLNPQFGFNTCNYPYFCLTRLMTPKAQS